jgi:anti-sigma factor RsiW
MNCGEARELLTEVAGGEIDGARADQVRAHAQTCDACAAELGELEATIGLMRRAGSEPLPDGFALSLHQALVAAGPPERTFMDRVRAAIAMRPMTFAACAAALAAIVSVGTTLKFSRHPVGTTPAQAIAYRVPESKVALVKIDFVAEKNIDDVAFEITLPDGLRFVSGGQQLAERTFRFQGKLSAGDNPIPIAVKGPRAGRFKVIAHAIGPALDITQEVVLEVTT